MAMLCASLPSPLIRRAEMAPLMCPAIAGSGAVKSLALFAPHKKSRSWFDFLCGANNAFDSPRFRDRVESEGPSEPDADPPQSRQRAPSITCTSKVTKRLGLAELTNRIKSQRASSAVNKSRARADDQARFSAPFLSSVANAPLRQRNLRSAKNFCAVSLYSGLSLMYKILYNWREGGKQCAKHYWKH
jgi:hypothetical protein